MMSHKKIHRFLVQELKPAAIGNTLTIEDERIAKQINRVLKLRSGETVQFFADGSDSYSGTITDTTNSTVSVIVTDIVPTILPARTVIAAVSIVKGDAFELMVQKLTEIGVHTIVPIISGRTIKQSLRLNRLQAISDEAVEQCGATARVAITDPMTLKECFAQFPHEAIVFDPVADTQDAGTLPDTVVCYIGPEGGWDEKDEEIINSFNPRHLQLTERVLRTETAAIVGAYMLLRA